MGYIGYLLAPGTIPKLSVLKKKKDHLFDSRIYALGRDLSLLHIVSAEAWLGAVGTTAEMAHSRGGQWVLLVRGLFMKASPKAA